MRRADAIAAATQYWMYNKCSAADLQIRFGIGVHYANAAIDEAMKQINENWQAVNNPEKEIEGMDHTYNPERAIEHIETRKNSNHYRL